MPIAINGKSFLRDAYCHSISWYEDSTKFNCWATALTRKLDSGFSRPEIPEYNQEFY